MTTSDTVQAPQGIPYTEVLPRQEAELRELQEKRDALQELVSTIQIPEAADKVRELLPSLAMRIEARKRIVAVLKAGYDLMTPAIGGTWAEGFIVEKDPRPWAVRRSGWWGWAVAILAGLLTIGGLLAFSAMTSMGSAIEDIVAFAFVGLVVSLVVAVYLGPSVLPMMVSASLRRAGLPTGGEVLFLTKDRMPQSALLALQRARESGLFDRIQALAPREAFLRVVAVDPIIFGEIAGGDCFLIAQFDLGEDLKQLGLSS